MKRTAIQPTRIENYPEWYQQVITAADLAETSPVRGCMVIKPWGYAIWELIQKELDRRFKETGHQNAYFPLLIPLSQLEREAQHIEGFAKECAVVTHHRLKEDGQGKLKPEGLLEEPYIIRPTSETMIGTVFAKWIQSHRDLPLLINQWANVMRWEMRTRLFLRTSEFLWQEGHTAHATSKDAIEETLMILNLYSDFAENVCAMPVIKGEKTISERFPGAVATYCMEALMQDGKALQAGTSHFLGQNFSKAYNIQFTDTKDEQDYVWTTSWGVSTRLIGGLIMTHSDDDGLVLPPRIAPQQVVILPIIKNEQDRSRVLNYCNHLQKQLKEIIFHGEPIRVRMDTRDLRGGEKNWEWVKKGVPLRLEVGPKDLDNHTITAYRRDYPTKEKFVLKEHGIHSQIQFILEEIQSQLFLRAQQFRDDHFKTILSLQEFKEFFAERSTEEHMSPGFAICYAIDNPKIEDYLKPLKVSARCIPLEQESAIGRCIFTGEKTDKKIVFAKAY